MDIDLFVDKICKQNNLNVDKLMSNHRKEIYCDFRRALIYILKNKYKLTLIQIRDYLGKKSHSAIRESLKRHEELIIHNKKYKNIFDSVWQK